MDRVWVSKGLDSAGRLHIPKQVMKQLQIMADSDSMEFFTEEDGIVLQKYQPGCNICGEIEDTYVHLHGKRVCHTCIDKLNQER